jgi:hypothetical protein
MFKGAHLPSAKLTPWSVRHWRWDSLKIAEGNDLHVYLGGIQLGTLTGQWLS